MAENVRNFLGDKFSGFPVASEIQLTFEECRLVGYYAVWLL
jgi:hypothetical protein